MQRGLPRPSASKGAAGAHEGLEAEWKTAGCSAYKNSTRAGWGYNIQPRLVTVHCGTGNTAAQALIQGKGGSCVMYRAVWVQGLGSDEAGGVS